MRGQSNTKHLMQFDNVSTTPTHGSTVEYVRCGSRRDDAVWLRCLNQGQKEGVVVAVQLRLAVQRSKIHNMTRNNDTSYRTKGRAVFLAAIMLVSMVGMSVAFAGSAAAVAPSQVDDFDEPDQFPSVVEAGQEYRINVSDDAIDNNDGWYSPL